jgi:hypothetical protein
LPAALSDTLTVNPPVRTVGERLYWLMPAAAAVSGLGLLYVFAPRYLFHQGFPLDDAWIHAVYAREFARSGTLAYNPGIPATGETAPLWPLLLAPIHRLAGNVEAVVCATKFLGFALQAAACTIIGVTLASLDPDRRHLAFAAGALVAIHPDLLAASVSGMEISLAALVAGAVLAATVAGSRRALVVLGAVAICARPEVAAIAAVIPAFFWVPVSLRKAVILSAASVAGSVAALAVLGIRNRIVSGLILPATFYAKANTQSLFSPVLQHIGFTELLGQIPLVDWAPALVAGLAAALFLLRFGSESAWDRAAGALYLSGLVYCGLSFALIPPVDPPAFYHQRYVLPGVIPMIAAIPLLIDALVRRTIPAAARVVNTFAIVALAAVLVVRTPARVHHLSNDAQNIDDVQVAFGKVLANAAPTSVAWVVDAGGSRFFGRSFVVDTIGLNTPELLGAGAQAYLDAHPPTYLDVFPGWSRIEGDRPVRMPATPFEATTPYTVTSAPSMRLHLLVNCEPPRVEGHFVVRGKRWAFRCSS